MTHTQILTKGSTHQMTTTTELHKATITVAFVNQPKEGKKTGTVKDTNDQFWLVWPNKLSQFQPGETYEVVYEQKGPLRCITTHHSVATEPQLRQMPAKPQGEPRPSPQPAPAPQNGNGFYRPTHPKDARRMFVTATLGHFIETGRVDLDGQKIADAIMQILAAYDATMAKDDEDRQGQRGVVHGGLRTVE